MCRGLSTCLFSSIREGSLLSFQWPRDAEAQQMASGNHDVFSWHANARISNYVNSNRMANLDVFDKRFLKSYQEHKKLHESTVSFCCTSQLSMLYGGSLKHGDLSGLLLVKAGPQASHFSWLFLAFTFWAHHNCNGGHCILDSQYCRSSKKSKSMTTQSEQFEVQVECLWKWWELVVQGFFHKLGHLHRPFNHISSLGQCVKCTKS